MRAALLALALVLGGCGAAQGILSGQATIVMETQPTRYQAYQENHGRCLAASADMEAYQACMLPSRVVARAVDAYASTLRAAQAALDASDQEGFQRMLPCLIETARRLLEAMADASVPIPDAVSEIARMVPGGLCNG